MKGFRGLSFKTILGLASVIGMGATLLGDWAKEKQEEEKFNEKFDERFDARFAEIQEANFEEEETT
jgi:hypothetical protein